MGYGAYGKLPALGDFVRFGLGHEVVSAWDAWLQDGLLSLSEALGDRWEACYMSAPLWRFSLPPGVVGPKGLTGVMMPSVDRVGRKFPLTFAREAEDGETGLAAHLGADETFAQLEDLALAALEDSMTLETLKEDLEAIEQPAPIGIFQVQREEGALAIRLTGATVSPLVLAARLATLAHDDQAYWSAHLEGDSRFFACKGLPKGDALSALFDLDAALWPEAAA